MYARPWRAVDGVTYVDWPAWSGERTLADVAERVIRQHAIDAGDVVGGSSLGGMVALEVARRAGCRRVVLIGSAKHPSEIEPVLRRLAPLGVVGPVAFTQSVVQMLSHTEAARQYCRADPRFVQAMCGAVARWRGVDTSGLVLHRIHGTHDRIIRCPATHCERIPGAGHLLPMTHAAVCAAWLAGVKSEECKMQSAE